MKYVYFCTDCGYLGAMEGEDAVKSCPSCGRILTCTDCTKEKWTTLSSDEKNAIKGKWKAPDQEQDIPPEESVKRFSGERLGIPGLVFHIDGARGRSIDIYPYKCVLSTSVTFGSVLTRNATDGEKTIYYQDCIGLQIKQPGLTLGYIQFETSTATQNNAESNFFNENTFTYDTPNISSDEMALVVRYIKEQLDKIKEAQRKSWEK